MFLFFIFKIAFHISYFISEIHNVAFVEYLKHVDKSKLDPLLKCEKLVWETRSKRYKLIELENIFKIVQVLPSFKSDDKISNEFYLNKFIFK